MQDNIRIIRSKNRTKTVQARRRGDVIEVLAPARMSDAELQPIIENLVQRIKRKTSAADLVGDYTAGGRFIAFGLQLGVVFDPPGRAK